MQAKNVCTGGGGRAGGSQKLGQLPSICSLSCKQKMCARGWGFTEIRPTIQASVRSLQVCCSLFLSGGCDQNFFKCPGQYKSGHVHLQGTRHPREQRVPQFLSARERGIHTYTYAECNFFRGVQCVNLAIPPVFFGRGVVHASYLAHSSTGKRRVRWVGREPFF